MNPRNNVYNLMSDPSAMCDCGAAVSAHFEVRQYPNSQVLALICPNAVFRCRDMEAAADAIEALQRKPAVPSEEQIKARRIALYTKFACQGNVHVAFNAGAQFVINSIKGESNVPSA